MNGKDNFLLDTNIVLGFLNGHTKINNLFHQQKLAQKKLFVSQITRIELLGFHHITPDEESDINQFLSLVEILPLTDELCEKTITLRRKSRLKIPDAFIAATAIVNNIKLITCDIELSNLKELESINPCR